MTVQAVATALGLTIVERQTGGSFGAHLVTTAEGANAVLKVMPTDEFWAEERVRSAVEIAEGLRRDGYPIPKFLDVGVAEGHVFTVQEAIDGEVPSTLRPVHAKKLIELRKRHVGAADVPDHTWGDRLVSSIRRNDGEVQTLLRFAGNHRVLLLLDEVVAVGERIDPAIFTGNDVVHSDFTSVNVLVNGDDIVAIIDWDCARVGDSRADLIKLAWSIDPGTGDQHTIALLHDEVDSIPDDVTAALAAKLLLGGYYFALRTGSDTYLEWLSDMAEHWRQRWRRFLPRRRVLD